MIREPAWPKGKEWRVYMPWLGRNGEHIVRAWHSRSLNGALRVMRRIITEEYTSPWGMTVAVGLANKRICNGGDIVRVVVHQNGEIDRVRCRGPRGWWLVNDGWPRHADTWMGELMRRIRHEVGELRRP